MKIAKRDLKLIIILAGLAIFGLLYFFVYNTFLDMTEDTKTEIATLLPQVQALRDSQENFDEYVKETAEYKLQIEETLEKYPAMIYPEEFLMWLLEWEEMTGVTVDSVSFTEPNVVTQFQAEVVSTVDGVEDRKVVTVDGGVISVSTTNEMTYTQLKNSINAIYAYPQPTYLDSVSVTYNPDTASLTGNYMISKYYINYEGAAHYPWPMPNIGLGNENLFGYNETTSVDAVEG